MNINNEPPLSSFSRTLVLGPVLLNFVNNGYFGRRLNNDNKIYEYDLIEYLPLLKNGYALRASITMLIRIYTRINGLNDNIDKKIYTDSLMHYIFAGPIPALFYLYQPIPNFRLKILMENAIDRNLIQKPLNTYEVISRLYPTFNPEHHEYNYLRYYVLLNSYLREDIENDPNFQEVIDFIDDENILKRMIDEFEILRGVLLIINEFQYEGNVFNNNALKNITASTHY
jgi:hypothetical protein